MGKKCIILCSLGSKVYDIIISCYLDEGLFSYQKHHDPTRKKVRTCYLRQLD